MFGGRMVDGRMSFVQQVLFPNCCELETGSWVEAGIYVVKACSVWRPNCLQVPTRQNLKLEVENYHLDLLWLLPLQSLGQSPIQPLTTIGLSTAAWRLMVSSDSARITTTLSPPDFTLFCQAFGRDSRNHNPPTALHCQRRN